MKIYIVSCHGENDLVTASYDEAVKFVSDDNLDQFGQKKIYRKLMDEYGTTPDEYISLYEVEVPDELKGE